VCGIGYNGNEYQATNCGKITNEYQLWLGMLRRCTEEYFSRNQTYKGVSCSENFKSYTFFYEWCQEQVGFGNKDEKGNTWQLDKDILVKGNKLYSEDTCVFIPSRLNKLLTKNDSARGEHPLGVYFHKHTKKYYVQCQGLSGKQEFIGYYATKEGAFQAYKIFKEDIIKSVANKYKSKIDSRVYEALILWKIEIDD
jgi:hypothetical protein